MKATKSSIIKIGILLAIAALLIGAMTISVSASTESVSYEEASWNASTETVTRRSKTVTATVITGSETELGVDGATTYYIVSSDVMTEQFVTVYGEVHIILDANYTIGVNGASSLEIRTGATLHIYKKTGGGTATLSAANIYTYDDDEENENIYIHDGTVKVSGTLGSKYDGTFGDLLIYGGTVEAAQIAIAAEGTAGTIGIYGGTVKAISDSSSGPAIGATAKLTAIEIYNSKVSAQILNDIYNYGSVIGTQEGSIDRIVVKNSQVDAYYSASNSYAYVSSIGSGRYGSVDSILVADSNLRLFFGNYAAGIGGLGCHSVEVTNSTVTMIEENWAGNNNSAGVKADIVTVNSSTLDVEIRNNDEYVGHGISAFESVTINSGSFNFSTVGTGISSEGAVTVNSGAFASETSIIGATLQNSNGDALYSNSITLSGANKGNAISAVNTNKGAYSVSGAKILTDDKKIVFYLPADTIVTSIVANGVEYLGNLKGTTEKTGTFYKKCECSSFAEGLCTNCGSYEPAELSAGYYLIYDLNDLLYVKDLVEGNLKNGTPANGNVNVKLMADVNIGDRSIGNVDFSYNGIFDGNGHTLTATAPTFLAVNGATFKNLIYDDGFSNSDEYIEFPEFSGTPTGNYGGLVTIATGDTVTFEQCIVSSSYSFSHATSSKATYDVNFGVFVGYSDADIVINNCAYIGNIDMDNIKGISCMVGKSDPEVSIAISNSYIYTYVKFYNSGSIYAFSNTSNNNTISNCYYDYSKTTGGTGNYGVIHGGATLFDSEITTCFADGTVTYKLNGGNSDGVWRQTIGTDALPNFKGSKVSFNYVNQNYDNHDHNATYTLTTVSNTNDTVTITCNECAPSGVNVTLTAPANAVYVPGIGKTYYEASVTVLAKENIVYKDNGSVMSGLPYQAGTYTAEVTVGDKTASVEFSIAKYGKIPAVKVTNVVKDTMSPADVQLAIVRTTEKPTEYYDWGYIEDYGGGYTITLTDTALYADKIEYTFKITPTDTRSIETVTGTVEIDVIDTQKPTVNLTIGTQNITLDAQSDGTFKYFFKTSKKVTVTATDEEHGSGIAKVYYLISENYDTDLSTASFAELQGNEIDIPADSKSFVFVKAVDNDGNATVVYTNGIVTYTDSVSDTETIDYTKFASDSVTAKLMLNGNTVSRIVMNGSTVLSGGTDYSVAADGTVTFVAEKLDELVASTHVLTVYYAPRGVEFVEASYNEAPASTEIELLIKKAQGSVTVTEDISKQYDSTVADTPEFESFSTGTVTVEYRTNEEGSVFETTAPKDVGSYIVRVTVAADANYTEESNTAEFRITKAPLKVIAKAHTITYGDVPSNKGVSYDGFKGSDTYAVLGGTLEYEYTYEQFGSVGTYVITPKGYTSSNYDITFETGILTVDKKTASFTTEDQKLMSGEIFDNTKFTHTGLLDGHTATISASGNEIAVDKILDANGEEVTENYNITYASKGEYHFYDANFTSDGTYHWHACKIAGCTDTTEKIECAGGTTTCSTRATCDECGSEYGSTNSFIHSFTNYVSDGNATAEMDGTKTAVCDYGCGETESVTDKGSRLEIAVGGFASDSVKSGDKEDLEELVSDIDELLADENISEERKTELENAKADAEALIGEIEENEKALEDAKQDIASYDIEQINSNDKAELESIVSDIDQLLEGDNLTEEEKGELEGVKADAEALIGEIEAVAEAKTNIESTVDSYGVDNVSSDDKTDLESVIENIDRLLASGNYTEEEKAELESEKAEVEALIEEIEKNAEAKADVEEKIASYEGGNVNSDDLAGLEAIIDTANELLEGDKLTEGERAEVESTKSEAEALISEIEGHVEAKEEVEGKLSDYDSESVKSDDKDSLVAIIDTVTTLLEDGSYTETEKAELEGTRTEAMALIGEIDKNAEAFNAVGVMLSGYDIETVTSDDAESIKTIVDTIDTLLSDGNYTEAEKTVLEDAKTEAMVLIDKIENADEDQTDVENEEQTGSDLSEKDNGNSATTTVVVVVIVIVILLGGGACLWIFVIKRRR